MKKYFETSDIIFWERIVSLEMICSALEDLLIASRMRIDRFERSVFISERNLEARLGMLKRGLMMHDILIKF